MEKELIHFYIASFLLFFSFNSLCAAGSYSKSHYQKDFGVSITELGVIDASHNVSGLIGTFLFMSTPWFKNKLMEMSLFSVLCWALGFGMVPVFHLLGLQHSSTFCVLYISSIIYGFGGATSNLSITMIIHRQRQYYHRSSQHEAHDISKEEQSGEKFSQSKDKAFLAVWSNHYNLSLILSESVFDLVIYTLGIGWQFPTIFWVCCNIISALFLYMKYRGHRAQKIRLKPLSPSQNLESVETQTNNTQLFRVNLRNVLTSILCNKKRIIIVGIYFSLKVINNHVVTIFPLFLSRVGLQGNEGKLVSIYFFSAILGSLLLNGLSWVINQIYLLFYTQRDEEQNSSSIKKIDSNITLHFSNVLTSYLTLLIVLILIGYMRSRVEDQRSITIFALFMCCLGLFIGGLINYAHTSLLLETIKDPQYQKDLKTVGEEPQISANERRSANAIDFENATVGLFFMSFQLMCIPGYVIAFKLIETQPQLYLWEYAFLCLIVFLGELYRNYLIVKDYSQKSQKIQSE